MRPLHYYNMSLKALVGYRPDTSDEHVIRAILIDRTEYSLFVNCHPRVIFDIGANIGATSILMANSYPNAVIFAFEPEKENYEILVENTKEYPNVRAYNIALGAETCKRPLMASDDPNNLGGFSFHSGGTNPDIANTVDVVDINEFMKSVRVENIDLLKVDTEGCEFEIISALKNNLPKYIMGEAHSVLDFKMFDLLSETHDLDVRKPMSSRVYPFYAKRKNASP